MASIALTDVYWDIAVTGSVARRFSTCVAHAMPFLQKNADFCFIIIFTCEAVTKIIVYGLLLQPGAYLKSPWNILDFVTVVVGIVLLSVSDADGQLTSLKSLRTLRALRPIRMASRAPGMKVCSCRRSAIVFVTQIDHLLQQICPDNHSLA